MLLQPFLSVVDGMTSLLHRSVWPQKGITIMRRNTIHKINEISRIGLGIGVCSVAKIYVTISSALQS